MSSKPKMELTSLVAEPTEERRDLVPENCRFGSGDVYMLDDGDMEVSRRSTF